MNRVSATGGVAVALTIFFSTLNLYDPTDKCAEPFNINFLIRDKDGNIPLKNSGKLVLYLDNIPHPSTDIDQFGRAIIEHIPVNYSGKYALIALEAPGWQFINGSVQKQFKVEAIHLH